MLARAQGAFLELQRGEALARGRPVGHSCPGVAIVARVRVGLRLVVVGVGLGLGGGVVLGAVGIGRAEP